MTQLTEQEHAFCRHYVDTNYNGAESVRRSRFDVECERMKAQQLLNKPEIVLQITRLQDQARRKMSISHDYVLQKSHEVAEMDFADILTEDMNIKPVHQWPKIWRQAISGVKLDQMLKGRNPDGSLQIEAVFKSLKWPDMMKALETIGRHKKIRAFAEDIRDNEETAPPIAINIGVADAKEEITITRGKKRDADSEGD